MKNEQLDLLEKTEETRESGKPYFNAMGEPLPWEMKKPVVNITRIQINKTKNSSGVDGGVD